jgi:hypothetical protein
MMRVNSISSVEGKYCEGNNSFVFDFGKTPWVIRLRDKLAAMAGTHSGPTRVYVETTPRRTFAMAIDWPGWGRAGKSPEAALSALADYATRYARVAEIAQTDFPAAAFSPAAGQDLVVVEQLPGNATTEFGAPAAIAGIDSEPYDAATARLTAALLSASWAVLDQTAANSPEELRKGPRGGGRDRDAMLEHVLGAEVAYAGKIGVKISQPRLDDQAAIASARSDILVVIGAESSGGPVRPKGWPVRYAARRFAWHALDHAWEMEDRRYCSSG